MFDKFEKIAEYIKKLNFSIDKYTKDSIVQSLPSKAIVNRAKKHIEANEFKEAENVLNEALELPQEDALVFKYLGFCAERTGRFDDAMRAYKKSANINPQDKEIWMKLGFSQVQCQLFEDAEKAFENANKINPSNTDVYAGWGMSLMKQKRFSEAHEKFVEAVRLNKYNFMAMLLAAIMEIRLERYEDAELKLNFLSTVAPNETNTYEYARLKYLKKDYVNAEYYAKKALEFNPVLLNAYLVLGKVYRKQLEIQKAEENYKLALTHHIDNPDLYYEWGQLAQYCENYELAKEKFEKVLEISPDEGFAKAGLGLCYAALDSLEEAEPLINEELEKVPDCYLALKGKAMLLYKRKDFQGAVDGFKKILAEDEADYACNYYIAKSFEALGNDILTKEYYENAVKKFPMLIVAYVDYAKFLIGKKEYAEAQRKLRKALKFDDNNLEILNMLFYVSYILVKENLCEYNIKEVIALADKIKAINSEAFQYNQECAELENILNSL